MKRDGNRDSSSELNYRPLGRKKKAKKKPSKRFSPKRVKEMNEKRVERNEKAKVKRDAAAKKDADANAQVKKKMEKTKKEADAKAEVKQKKEIKESRLLDQCKYLSNVTNLQKEIKDLS